MIETRGTSDDVSLVDGLVEVRDKVRWRTFREASRYAADVTRASAISSDALWPISPLWYEDNPAFKKLRQEYRLVVLYLTRLPRR